MNARVILVEMEGLVIMPLTALTVPVHWDGPETFVKRVSIDSTKNIHVLSVCIFSKLHFCFMLAFYNQNVIFTVFPRK